MGMRKRMKDMKDMVNAAPGIMEQAQQMSAQAQQMAAAHQVAAQAQLAAAQMGQDQATGRVQAMGQFGGLPAARMANASQLMAAQTQAANAAAAAAAGLANGTAIRRTVMISGMRQVGMINFDLLVEFDLTVMPDGLPPYPATTQQAISQLQIGQLRPGMTLQGAVDQSNSTAVWLDLASMR